MDDHLANLYDTDALIWTETQIALLRAGKFDQLDVENIISELGYQVRKDKREVASRLHRLIMHLLKYQFQPARICNSWRQTIKTQRNQIAIVLNEMPSLRAMLDEYVVHAYPRALKDAAAETHLPISAFPTEIPYTLNQLLDENFLPGENEKAVEP
ncbi:DUF29 family protein [Pseudoduganella sp. FT25W]|jgi:hypothetical protein|uniref:DUF29 family protein n=1 Tax=Duganella alba TaxID=2666081 RepID=A0A6L5QCX0_9BURK|nr:DUF29 domain-containing protein [Duganella alba]MRX07112.1 DUF29 family protein [Duganella alba]MRX15193.1 DUF29 family protein [Duganella alba]